MLWPLDGGQVDFAVTLAVSATTTHVTFVDERYHWYQIAYLIGISNCSSVVRINFCILGCKTVSY